MYLNRAFTFFSLSALALALSCGSETAKTTEAAKAPEKKQVALYTARPCLERMAYSALKWQSDALPYHLISHPNAESNGQDGRSAVWEATFSSMGTHQSKIFSCSGSLLRESPPYGVTSNKEFNTGTVRTFLLNDVAVDSDAVAKTALEHGGADIVKKDPQQPVYYELAVHPDSGKLVWAAIFGLSEKDNKGIGLIDAGTAKFIGALIKQKH